MTDTTCSHAVWRAFALAIGAPDCGRSPSARGPLAMCLASKRAHRQASFGRQRSVAALARHHALVCEAPQLSADDALPRGLNDSSEKTGAEVGARAEDAVLRDGGQEAVVEVHNGLPCVPVAIFGEGG